MKYYWYPLICGIALLMFTGCAQRKGSYTPPRPEPMSRASDRRELSVERDLSPDSINEDELTGAFDLNKALSLALLHNPRLASFSREVRASEARALQAGVISNPDIEFEMDDINANGFDDVSTSINVSQPLELAGKRVKRARSANMSVEVDRWEYEIVRLEVLADVKKAFAELIAAEEKLELTKEMAALSEQMLDIVAKRVEAGKDSPIEKTNAQISVMTAEIDVRNGLRDLYVAKTNLATVLGISVADFEFVDSDLDILEPAPEFDAISDRIPQNPSVAKNEASVEYYRLRLDLEKAKRFPDLNLGAGTSSSLTESKNTYRFGLGISIPVFNRNRPAVSGAVYDLEKAQIDREAIEVAVMAELSEAYQRLISSYDEAIALRDNILPASEDVYSGISDGFSKGRFSYIEVLDAQRTLFELRSQYIETCIEYSFAKADIERLIGKSIDEISN